MININLKPITWKSKTLFYFFIFGGGGGRGLGTGVFVFDGFFWEGVGWFGGFLIFIIGKQGLINRSIQIISRYIKNKNHISVESFSLSLVYGHE